MCAGRTLYKDSAAISLPAYLVASNEAIITCERNPSTITNVADDTPMARPNVALLGDKNRSDWRPCSRYRPFNIVPFDRPVLTPEGDDCPLPAFDYRAICHSPVIPLAADSGRAARSIVAHVER